MDTWQVIFLGWLEGLTEYLPVSSTGHLLLVERLLGVSSPGRTFEVLIQLGAILALLTVYSAKLLQLARDLPRDPKTQRFVLAVLIAFLPAAVIGAAAHDIIKNVLFESPVIICLSLVIGGIVLLVVDRMNFSLLACPDLLPDVETLASYFPAALAELLDEQAQNENNGTDEESA